jgi:hypothetical protein
VSTSDTPGCLPGQGGPGRLDLADLDGRTLRPVRWSRSWPMSWGEPQVGDDDQGRSGARASNSHGSSIGLPGGAGRRPGPPAGVPPRRVMAGEVAVSSFSSRSRPARGRPPRAGTDTTGTANRPHRAARHGARQPCARRALPGALDPPVDQAEAAWPCSHATAHGTRSRRQLGRWDDVVDRIRPARGEDRGTRAPRSRSSPDGHRRLHPGMDEALVAVDSRRKR